MEATKPYRLPTTVRPRSYLVELDARVGQEAFRGRATVELQLQAPRDSIELHARDLTLAEVHLTQGGHTHKGTVLPDPEREMVSLRFAQALHPGDATLVLHFEGKVSRNMEGLYLSQDGAERCLATQCEETDARAIFPCFDEPAFKATLQWRVTTDAAHTVLANGPLVGVEAAEGGKSRTWTFAPTKPMSSYLAALAIGDLASTPETLVKGVPLRVWAMRGKEHLGAFGNDFAARLLPWYEDYFGAPYHFGKYDQVAVPSFSAGAMENAGLVVFRQALLLRDPEKTSWRQERQIALVIAHEFAHMWFGNLVTMAWWDDIWLNEAFAEWMAHKATHAMSPEYKVWNEFQAGRNVALTADALESTHAIYSPVETPQQATELFDAITYQKGCAVMRMLEGFLGEEAFRAGLRTYMTEFAERNAQGADLWRHLERASGQPVAAIMSSWILQPGHPIVHVALAPDGRRLRLRQERFYSEPGKTSDQAWRVPMRLRWADEAGLHEASYLLEGRESEAPLKVTGRLRWAHANADGYGFYRQDLVDALLAGVLTNLHELTPIEQANLLEDQWGLVRNGAGTLARYLDVLDGLVNAARDPSVVERIVGHLATLEWFLEGTQNAEALGGFRGWIGKAFHAHALELGFASRPGEARDDAQRRVAVLEALAGLGHDPAAKKAALAIADKELEDPAAVDPNLAGPAVALAAQFGDARRLDLHVGEYQKRKAAQASPAEIQRYLLSLPQFRHPPHVKRVLGMMADGTMPLEAVGPLLRLMLQKRHAQVLAWEHMKSHWTQLRETLGDMWTGSLVEHTGQLPPELRPEIAAFYDAHLKGVAEQARGRALEALAQRGELQARIQPELVAWFRQHG